EPARTDGPLKGGRMLQPALYAAAAEQQCKGQVAAFEYRFPTPIGENRSVPYGPVQFRQARTVVEGLLAHPAAGEFLPTNDSSDCKLCDFQQICRVQAEGWTIESPRAKWAEEHAPDLEQYAGMLRRRSPGDG
ncbi:MAG TPA: PD-(D/E)XK nuclease family protein, partial [Gemmatimonadales bacterium]|nr:PD-(D/E)XK nuclease family protein [Gemmatimonadales bacterium]